jgi:hypothetical protein
VAKMEIRDAYRVVGKHEGKRQFGRSKRRWNKVLKKK